LIVFWSRPIRSGRLSANQIANILDDILSDSDISGISDDSDNYESFRPRGEVASSSSEDEPEDVEDMGPVCDVLGPMEMSRMDSSQTLKMPVLLFSPMSLPMRRQSRGEK
jgi:hypothetical protein